MIKNYILYQY